MLRRFFQKNKEPSAVRCPIDFSLGDDRETVLAFLKHTIPVFASQSASGHLLDLSACEYMGPHAAALVLAEHLQAKKDQRPFDVLLPEGKKVHAFLGFSGLRHHLFSEPPPNAQHPENVTVPLCIVKHSSFGLIVPVMSLIRRFAQISADDETYLGNSIFEVTQNVEDHADSAVGAVFCARYLEKPGKIRVAIVDRGNGIATSLRNAGHRIDGDDRALLSVVKGGISARSKPHNRGVGLSNLWSHVVKAMEGEIFIVSEGAVVYTDRQGRSQAESIGTRFAGTGVFFTVPVADKFR